MHELLRWNDGTLYVNGWLIFGLFVAVAAGISLGVALVRFFSD